MPSPEVAALTSAQSTPSMMAAFFGTAFSSSRLQLLLSEAELLLPVFFFASDFYSHGKQASALELT